MISRDFTLETARCLLRCPLAADIPYIFAATRYAGFNDGMLWDPPKNIEELHESFRRSIKGWDAGTSYTFTILARASGEFLGRIVILQSDHPLTWNIGFWIYPTLQNQGFMTEAAHTILKFGFHKLDAERIEAYHAAWNTASQRVLEKIGMKFMTFIPQGFQKKGQWVAENLMGITKEEWLGLDIS